MLPELQQALVAGIYGDETRVTACLKPTARLDAARQLSVYRASIFGGMQKALDEAYPVCRQLVGEAFFAHMGWRYITQTASRHYDLTRYGESLAQFIENEVPTETVPWLADMARLEWACHHARHRYEEAETPVRDVTMPAGFQPLQFRLAPHLSLIDTPYPLGAIWDAHQPGSTQALETIIFDEQPCCFVIWRENDDLNIDTVDETMRLLLDACRRGAATVGQLSTRLAVSGEEARFAECLVVAWSRGWLCVR